VQLAEAGSDAAAIDFLDAEELTKYAPFYLFLLSEKGVVARAWDGTVLSAIEPKEHFWTTSSYRPTEVVRWRHDWWSQQTGEGKVSLEQAAHLLGTRCSERSSFGLTMDREDARTVSQIQLRMLGANMSFSYLAREAGGMGFEPPVTIESTG
jgi:hypothetical protein